jgi:hypothetical protein
VAKNFTKALERLLIRRTVIFIKNKQLQGLMDKQPSTILWHRDCLIILFKDERAKIIIFGVRPKLNKWKQWTGFLQAQAFRRRMGDPGG